MKIREGDALGVHETLKWGVQMGVEKLIVETDASLSAPVDHETTFGNMIEAYRSILQVKSDFKVIWVR